MKALIFKYIDDLRPVGGSSGYCYNIFVELQRRKNEDICFLSKKASTKDETHNTIKKYFASFTKLFFGKSSVKLSDLSPYDIIHFHSAKDLYRNRRVLKRYKGIVILTTHSPVPSHLEMVDNIKNHHQIIGKMLGKHAFSYIDKYAFNRANYILFPCKEAEESYYKHWEQYKRIHDENKSKYLYIETGINPVKAKISSSEYRKRYNLTDNDFVISYVGRHNEIKGYDRLIEIAKLVRNNNIRFLIGGKEGPIYSPGFSNWIEVGWTDDPYSLVACSDLFVLPNKETYFDIVLLEVLSLGKNCIISRTGGNKSILSNGCNGILGFDSTVECASIIDNISQSKSKSMVNEKILNLFSAKYSIGVFVDKYISLLEKIYEQSEKN